MASAYRAPIVAVCQPERLLERLHQSLDFAVRNIERMGAYTSEWGAESDTVLRLEDQVCTQASFLLLITGRLPQAPDSVMRLRNQIAELLIPRVRTPRMHDLLARCPQFGVTVGSAHVLLTNAGYPDPSFDPLVISIFGEGYHRMEDNPPWQIISSRWVEQLAMGGGPATFRDLVPFSLLGGRTHPIYWRPEEPLAVARSIFGMTDFGRQSLPAALRTTHARAVVDAGLLQAFFDEDFENQIRFLIASLCLADSPSAYAAIVREQVERAWSQLGFLPGSSFEADSFQALSGDAAAAYAFSQLYVSNFLGGVLCALELSLRPTYLPSSSTEVHPLEPWIARRLSVRGTPASLQSAWVHTVAESRLADRDLVRILSDGVLLEACHRYDLFMLAETLKDSPHPASPTRQEAEAFLERQQRYQTLK